MVKGAQQCERTWYHLAVQSNMVTGDVLYYVTFTLRKNHK